MTKTAMITICGRPNVGKSTLTNALVGEKVAIVSAKPQTTRNRITALVQHGETQFVLMDTPPAGVVVDALEIAKYCDGALVVVSYNRYKNADQEKN